MKIHVPGTHAGEAPADPGTPHEFVEINDPGIGAMAAGLGSRGGGFGIASVAVTDNYVRKSRCGLPGCGRERHDPIHEAPED